jgi:hypothetical protein
MAPRRIIGVDFSGEDGDDKVGKTWVTKGLFDGDKLTIEDCHPISRNDLKKLLMKLPDCAVAAMDFPFSVPAAFAREEFKFKGTLLPEMWETIYNQGNLPKYIKKIRPRLRKGGNLQKFNKLMRQWDSTHFPEAYPPLNPAVPEMSPMTFYGMKMLHTLWKNTNCKVPPLDNTGRTGPVLLETMPGVILRAFCLPSKNYKTNNRKEQETERLENRKKILDGLAKFCALPVENLDAQRKNCEANDDCLDSIVAAVSAALWAKDPTLFHQPEDHQDPDLLAAAKKEGCIFGLKCIME